MRGAVRDYGGLEQSPRPSPAPRGDIIELAGREAEHCCVKAQMTYSLLRGGFIQKIGACLASCRWLEWALMPKQRGTWASSEGCIQ